MKKQKISSSEFAKRMGAYSHGYKIDAENSEIIFTTGQIAVDKDRNVLYTNDPEKQAELVFEGLQKILNRAGASLDDVVKPLFFVTNIKDFKETSRIRNKYFKNSEPVSTLLKVNRLIKMDAELML